MLAIIFSAFKFLGGIASGFFGVEQAKIAATAQVETATIEGEAAVQTKWWFVAILQDLFAIPPAIYLGKLFVWDKVLKMGVTDPLSTELNYVLMIIVASIFLQGAIKLWPK